MRHFERITGGVVLLCAVALFFRGLAVGNLPQALLGSIFCLLGFVYTLMPDRLGD